MIVLSVLNTFAASVVMAAVAWIGLRVFRANAATRYWTWWAVLAALVAMLGWPQRVEPVASTIPVSTVAVAPIEIAPRVDWFVWIALAWAAFAAYRLLRIAVSYAHLRRIIRNAHPIDPTRLDALRASHGVSRSTLLLASNDVSGPISAGYLQASIIVPEAVSASLTPEELDHVLLHELAHVARRDDWTKLAARLTGAFLGLHPVAAFALSRIERERERACDDWVAAATGDPKAYAASLARVFELSRGNKEVLAAGMTGPQLGDRVTRLLAAGHRFSRGASRLSLLVITAALAMAVIVGLQAPAWVVLAQDQPPVVNAPPVPPAPAPVTPTRDLVNETRVGLAVEFQRAAEARDEKLRFSSAALDPLYAAMNEKRLALIAVQDTPDREAAMHGYELAKQAYYDTAAKIAGSLLLRLPFTNQRTGEKDVFTVYMDAK